MGGKGNDAFQSLIASVPGVDTSGFVKRSMIEQKAASKNAAGKSVTGFKSSGNRLAAKSGSHQGLSSQKGSATTAVADGHSRGVPVQAYIPSSSASHAILGPGAAVSENLGPGSADGPSPHPRAASPGLLFAESTPNRDPFERAARKENPDAAFQNLIVGVPELDASGVSKRSMNEQKAGGGSWREPSRVEQKEGQAGLLVDSPGLLDEAVGLVVPQLAQESGNLVDGAPGVAGGADDLLGSTADACIGAPTTGGGMNFTSASSPPSAYFSLLPSDELDGLGVAYQQSKPSAGAAGLDDLFDGIPGVQASPVPLFTPVVDPTTR